MKYCLSLFFFSFFCVSFSVAQNVERAAVIQVVNNLFDGMRAGDSTMVRNAFAEGATLQTIFRDKKGNHHIESGNLDEFATAVGTPHDAIWDEKIWSYDVNIDADMATVWTEYTFYAGEKLSHCGVNNFILHQQKDGWKIINITDTRTRKNCQEEADDEVTNINTFMDTWHKAAATADEDIFFGSMNAKGIYIGTDATELWTRDEMKEWAAKYFERETAWAFTPIERNVYFSNDGQTAWFDEKLDTWMGVCRSSGVLEKTADKKEWKLAHYHLSMTIPNDDVKAVLEIVLPKENTKKGE